MMASELRRPESTQKSGRAECFIILNEEKRQLAVLQATPCLAFSNFTVESSSRILWRLVGPLPSPTFISPVQSASSTGPAHPPAVQRFIRTSIHPSSRSPRAPHLPQLRSCFRQSTCPSVLSFDRLPVRHAPLLYHPVHPSARSFDRALVRQSIHPAVLL